jgi:cytochrome c-type biogenesis protein CcmF
LLLFFICAIAIAANSWRIAETVRHSKLGAGGFVAHIGVAVTLAGLILSRGLEQKDQVLVMEGTPGNGLGYSIRYSRMTSDPQRDQANKAVFMVASLSGDGREAPFEAHSSYFFTEGESGGPEAFTSPAIQHSWSHDLYISLETPQVNLWDNPERFAPGETKTGMGVAITFLGIAQHGQPGQSDASFGAKLKVIEDGRTYYGEPMVTIGGVTDSPQISPSLRATIAGVDAGDGSILLQMPYTHVLYPIELYYKPMTLLVWLGIGIMTCGGLIAAAYRRPRGRTLEGPEA